MKRNSTFRAFVWFYPLIQSVLLILIILPSCGQGNSTSNTKDDNQHQYSNYLIDESSPYLLQHAHNPVNWYPWGDEALQIATAQNKMLIISIGYSSCHWCHVMEHESFEDTAVARFMNEHFVCIKVDREERPDVDQVYMTAAQLISGSGGWPLNALALPNGKPFYAGTYFPKSDWMKVLQYFVKMNNETPEAIYEQAEKVTEGINTIDNVTLSASTINSSLEDLSEGFQQWKENADPVKGGGKRAPKFPMPAMWEYLLQYNYLSQDKEALDLVQTTLDNMAYGGIYDHVGGGFARYSTDVDWLVPHFEKMLYDNGQLVSLYSHAWQVTKNPLYKRTVQETLDFIERKMTSTEGGFYSSLDADSDGEEGKFYVWKKSEIDSILSEDSKLFSDYYNVSRIGNWEHGKNILHRKESVEQFAKKYKMNPSDLLEQLDAGKKALLKARNTRIKPGLDDKILTAWNGLMLQGYVDAYRALDDDRYLKTALKNANFIVKNAYNKDGGLNRNYKNGVSTIPGFLDDYAFVISAFIDLYQATFDEFWLDESLKLTQYSIDHFFDTKSGMFFYTDIDHAELISRKMEVSDNVIPSSNSAMAKNLFFLGHYYYNQSFLDKAEQMLSNVQNDIQANLYFYANWGVLQAHHIESPFEVAIVGKECAIKRKQLDRHYLPNVLFLGGKKEGSLELMEGKLMKGETTIYVCKNKACRLPVSQVEDVLKQLKE